MNVDEFKMDFEEALINYNKSESELLFDKFVGEFGVKKFIEEIINQVFYEIGQKWENGEIAISNVYLSSIICEDILNKALPKEQKYYKDSLKTAIVTLEDHHVLGKRIISSLIKSAGYKLIDYGFGIRAEEVIEKAIKDEVKILLVSVLMYPSALRVKLLTDTFKQKRLDIKVMVGGAPFNMDLNLWKHVGADAMGKKAWDSINMIENWSQEVKIEC